MAIAEKHVGMLTIQTIENADARASSNVADNSQESAILCTHMAMSAACTALCGNVWCPQPFPLGFAMSSCRRTCRHRQHERRCPSPQSSTCRQARGATMQPRPPHNNPEIAVTQRATQQACGGANAWQPRCVTYSRRGKIWSLMSVRCYATGNGFSRIRLRFVYSIVSIIELLPHGYVPTCRGYSLNHHCLDLDEEQPERNATSMATPTAHPRNWY